MEYGARLTASFPGLKDEIELIVRLVYREIYGELKIDGRQLSAGRRAKKRMAHPLFWKSRVKAWVFSSGK